MARQYAVLSRIVEGHTQEPRRPPSAAAVGVAEVRRVPFTSAATVLIGRAIKRRRPARARRDPPGERSPAVVAEVRVLGPGETPGAAKSATKVPGASLADQFAGRSVRHIFA